MLAAEPGAGMWLGLNAGVELQDVRRAVGTPELATMLRWVPAEPGAVHHLPAGLIHALGAGVLVAEVQTPSDTTFRLYDWTQEYGRAPRTLHEAQGVHAMELEWELNLDLPGVTSEPPGSTIVDTKYYRIDRHELGGASRRPSRHSPGGHGHPKSCRSGPSVPGLRVPNRSTGR